MQSYSDFEREAFEFVYRMPLYDEGKPNQVEARAKLVACIYEQVMPVWRREEARPEPSDIAAIPQSGIDLIKEFEGFRAKAYPDAIHSWDVATIGYGTTRYEDGTPVSRGDTLTEAEAEGLLLAQCRRDYWPAVKELPYFDQMSEGQRGAMLSFAYNLGAGFYEAYGFSTISKMLSQRRWAEVPAALMLYVNPGTAAEEGLKRRREAEGKLWGQYSQAHKFGNLSYLMLPVSSPFGPRVHPVSGNVTHHDGVDFAAKIGTSLLSPIEGTVTIAEELAGYGLSVQIQGEGYSVFFAHLSELRVTRGDPVARGFLVGLTGNSGTSTGPHLHFEVGLLQAGGGIKLIDPMTVL